MIRSSKTSPKDIYANFKYWSTEITPVRTKLVNLPTCQTDSEGTFFFKVNTGTGTQDWTGRTTGRNASSLPNRPGR